jgi:hypothetical protein
MLLLMILELRQIHEATHFHGSDLCFALVWAAPGQEHLARVILRLQKPPLLGLRASRQFQTGWGRGTSSRRTARATRQGVLLPSRFFLLSPLANAIKRTTTNKIMVRTV